MLNKADKIAPEKYCIVDFEIQEGKGDLKER